jgi:hypothetical protein
VALAVYLGNGLDGGAPAPQTDFRKPARKPAVWWAAREWVERWSVSGYAAEIAPIWVLWATGLSSACAEQASGRVLEKEPVGILSASFGAASFSPVLRLPPRTKRFPRARRARQQAPTNAPAPTLPRPGDTASPYSTSLFAFVLATLGHRVGTPVCPATVTHHRTCWKARRFRNQGYNNTSDPVTTISALLFTTSGRGKSDTKVLAPARKQPTAHDAGATI